PDMQSGRTRALPCRMQAAQQRDADRVAMAWHCKRTGLSEQGKLLYEEGRLNLNHLPEEVAVNVEEDYQVYVRMLARTGEGKRERQKVKGERSKVDEANLYHQCMARGRLVCCPMQGSG